MTERKTDRQTDRDRQAERQTDRQRQREIERQTQRQTDRQTQRQTAKQRAPALSTYRHVRKGRGWDETDRQTANAHKETYHIDSHKMNLYQ